MKTHEHRCFECSKFRSVHDHHQHIIQKALHFPQVLRAHLLPPRLTSWTWFKSRLVEPAILQRKQIDLSLEHLDLFTDGSCLQPEIPQLSLGAWAVVSPQTGDWVSRGTVSGLRQNNDLAELFAVAEALDLSFQFPREVTIWCDSSYAAEGLHRLLMDHNDCPDDDEPLLWTHIQNLLLHRPGSLRVQHIAAHRSLRAAECPVDEWTALWNHQVDFAAKEAHSLRGEDFHTQWTLLVQEFVEAERNLMALQRLHIAISDFRLHADEEEVEEGDPDLTMRDWWQGRFHEADGSWIRDFVEDWLSQLPLCSLPATYSMKFARAMISWLHEQADSDDPISIRWTWM